jgi:hypothetical protein
VPAGARTRRPLTRKPKQLGQEPALLQLGRGPGGAVLLPAGGRPGRAPAGGGGSDDVDLDRTIEVLAERPVPEDTDIIVRERTRTRRCVLLAVDASGSMRGERVRNAAATVGALAAVLRYDPLPRLDVLLDVTGEHDLPLGKELAAAGHGRLYRIAGHRDVAPALVRAFSA